MAIRDSGCAGIYNSHIHISRQESFLFCTRLVSCLVLGYCVSAPLLALVLGGIYTHNLTDLQTPLDVFFNIMRVNYVVPLVVTVAGISLIPSAQAWGAAGDHLYLFCVHKTLTASRSRNGSYDRPNSSGESYTNSQLLKPIWGPAAPECTSQTLFHSQLYVHKP